MTVAAYIRQARWIRIVLMMLFAPMLLLSLVMKIAGENKEARR